MPPLPLLQLGRSIAWRASETSDSHHTSSGYKIQDLLLVNRITVRYEVLRYRGVRWDSPAVLLPRQQAKLARGTKDKERAMSQTSNTAIAVIGIDIGKNSFHASWLLAGTAQARIGALHSTAVARPILSRYPKIARTHRRMQPWFAASQSRRPLEFNLSQPEPAAKAP
jgi:hypothetical protein